MSRSLRFLALVLAALGSACGAGPVASSSPPSGGTLTHGKRNDERFAVRFAAAAEGKALLEAEDEFTRVLSGFDRSLRMKRTDAVADAEYRRFAGEQALDFTDEEKKAWAPALEELTRAIAGLELGEPPVVLLVKTTGREELDAAYTRRHAIVLPARLVADPELAPRVGLLAHELFHISSRASQPLRDRRYALFSFTPMRPITPPRELEATRLTNPDAPGLGHFMRVAARDGAEHAVVPVLSCDLTLEKAIAPDAWFKSLRVVLVEVDPERGTTAVDASGRTRMLDATETDWARRLGRNTGYVIHPEEVLADNFALIVKRRLGRSVKVTQPEFLDVLEGTLKRQ